MTIKVGPAVGMPENIWMIAITGDPVTNGASGDRRRRKCERSGTKTKAGEAQAKASIAMKAASPVA